MGYIVIHIDSHINRRMPVLILLLTQFFVQESHPPIPQHSAVHAFFDAHPGLIQINHYSDLVLICWNYVNCKI